MSLFKHHPHPHVPVNINEQHEAEQTGLNTRIAISLTKSVGTMWCAYAFAGIGIGGLVGAVTGNIFLALVFGSISSYLLQLVLLPVIMVGQNVLNRKQELLAEEQFNTTKKTFEDILQIMQHLSTQDEEILKQSSMLVELLGQKK